MTLQVTNNVVEWDDDVRPAMGRQWASVPSTRVQLTRRSNVTAIDRQCGATLRVTDAADSAIESVTQIRATLVKSNKQVCVQS